MAGDLRLICFQNLNADTDAELFLTEHLDELKPGAIGEGSEECFETIVHPVLFTILSGSVFGGVLDQEIDKISGFAGRIVFILNIL